MWSTTTKEKWHLKPDFGGLLIAHGRIKLNEKNTHTLT